MKDRVLKGVVASYYGQLITIAYQIFSVPLFLNFWGSEKYSNWLVLYTIPSIIGMMELGFFNVIINKLSSLNKKDGFDNLLSTVNSFLLYFLAIIVLIMLSSFFIFHFNKVYIVILIYSCLLILNNFYIELFKLEMKYHIGCFLANSFRLCEYICIVICIISNENIYFVFCFLLMLRSIYSLFLYKSYIKTFFEIKFLPYKQFCFKTHVNMRFLYDNSLLSLSMIFNNQFLIILINKFYGDSFVILFSTMRTFFRFSNQFVSALNMSLWQEVLGFVREKDYISHKKVIGKLLSFNVVALLLFMLLFVFIGQYIFNFWTDGNVKYTFFEYFSILSAVVFCSLWQPLYIYFNSLSKYSIYSYSYFLLQCILLVLIFLLSFNSFLISYLLTEIVMFVILSYNYKANQLIRL